MKKYFQALLSSKFILFFLLSILSIACQENKDQNNQAVSSSKTSKQQQQLEEQHKPVKEAKTDVKALGMSYDPGGLLKGSIAPNFFKEDQNGEALQLSNLLNEGPVVLLFYRGQWCPFCNQHMRQIKDSIPLMEELGARVIAVTPETPENAKIFLDKTKADIQVISDKDKSIMEAYKVLFEVTPEYTEKIRNKTGSDIAQNNGSSSAYLPVPASFVIDSTGKIRFIHYSPNFKHRASAQQLLGALRQIN